AYAPAFGGSGRHRSDPPLGSTYVRGTAGNWPRISPAGFFFVCTLTYVRPDSSASRTEAFTVARPRAPLLHGAHNGTITGPGFPRAPLWMCAAIARPLSFLNVNRHTI